jgi:hypothetical protein
MKAKKVKAKRKKRDPPLRRIDTRRFRVPPSHAVDLAHWPTRVPEFYRSKDDA